jgi:hypothetical protein
MGFLRPTIGGTLEVKIKNRNVQEQAEINSVMEYTQQFQLNRHENVTRICLHSQGESRNKTQKMKMGFHCVGAREQERG